MGITLKDLAAASGLSIRSVRRALQAEPGVSETSRRRITELAARLGYVPNVAARDLRTGRTAFIGILSSPRDPGVVRRRTLDLIDRIGTLGLHTLAAIRPDTPEAMRELVRGWSGLVNWVVFPSTPKPEVEAILSEFGISFITVDGTRRFANTTPLGIDRAVGIGEAVRHLIGAGRKNIWRCGGVASRREGFERAFRGAGRGVRHGTIEPDGETFEAGYRIGAKVVETKADAVFFDVDLIALGFLRYAHEHGIRVPETVAAIGFDDEQAGRFCTPQLATVAQPIEELNAAVLSLISGGKAVRQVFPTHFVWRESAGGRNAAPQATAGDGCRPRVKDSTSRITHQ